jgi:sterol desaturase/sphingolipid hydroxylase (fatty acid hydroxylase superfamily)
VLLQKAHKLRHQFEQRQQVILDASHTASSSFAGPSPAALVLLYALRVYWLNGFYIVSYGLAIYVLNLLLGFLSPRVDPEFASLGIDEDEDDGAGVLLGTRNAPSSNSNNNSNNNNNINNNNANAPLPSHTDQEFKPFIRRLPEFKFWLAVSRASLLSLVLTFFPFLDIPVFWPILVVYFFALFFVTMRKQIQHMIKHKYLPFSLGKPKFASASGGGQHHAPRRAD